MEESYNLLVEKFAEEFIEELRRDPKVLTPFKTGRMNRSWDILEVSQNRAIIRGVDYAGIQEEGAPRGPVWRGFIFGRNGAFKRAQERSKSTEFDAVFKDIVDKKFKYGITPGFY